VERDKRRCRVRDIASCPAGAPGSSSSGRGSCSCDFSEHRDPRWEIPLCGGCDWDGRDVVLLKRG
jgi:hypothetical protein